MTNERLLNLLKARYTYWSNENKKYRPISEPRSILHEQAAVSATVANELNAILNLCGVVVNPAWRMHFDDTFLNSVEQ